MPSMPPEFKELPQPEIENPEDGDRVKKLEHVIEALQDQLKDAARLRVSHLQRVAHQTAREKGWHDKPSEFGTLIALVHSELSEALEEARDVTAVSYNLTLYEANTKPVGIPIELADAVIRIMDICGLYNIDLEAAIIEKMAYNQTRPERHGGKKF